MLSRIREIIAPPEFPDDEDKTRQARVLNILLLSGILILLFLILIAIPFILVEKLFNTLGVLTLLLTLGVAYLLMRRGHVKLASVMFISGWWVTNTLFLLMSGGISSIGLMFYLVILVITELLLGLRGTLALVTACSAAGLGMVFLQTTDHPPLHIFPLPPITTWLDFTIVMLCLTIIMRIVLGDLQNALSLTKHQLEELERFEEALAKSEAKFRKLFETSRDFLFVTDIDGNILDFNEAACTMSGYSADELKAMKFQHLYFDPKERDDIIRQIIGRGFVENLETKGKMKNGTVVYVLATAASVKDDNGNLVGFQGSIRDITERKQSEDALRESEERFARLSAATTEGIGISDQGVIVDTNNQLANMLGYEPGGLIGLKAIDFVAPESRELVINNMRSGFEGMYEHLAIRKDGTIFPVEIRARMISYKGRQARVTIVHDITARKQAEQRLSQQIERLRALHTIDQAIVSSLDLSTILELLVWEIVDQLHVDATSVLLLNSQTQTLDFAAGQGFYTQALKFTSLKVGAGLAGRAAQDRKIVFVANLAETGNNPILAQSIVNEKFVTYLGIPLVAKDQLHGVMEIFHRSALDPDPNWLRFLETLAGQAAISIDNARLMEMTQKSLTEANALYRINQDLVEAIDAGQLMRNVVNLLQENFGYYYVQIFIADPATGDFVVHAGSGEIGEQFASQGYRLAAGEGIVGFTAETGKPFFTNDVDKVISFVRAPFLPETKSELAIPIKTGTKFLGLLDVHQMPPKYLTERDVQLVTAVADQLAVALQKAQLYADLQNSLRQEQATRTQLIHAEKLAVAGRLLASVSHELNNPLQAIQNALFLLKNEHGLSKQGQQDLKIVLSESERMATLLERLRVTYQPVRAEDFQSVQINNIIEDIHALVVTTLRHARISFEFHPDPDLPTFSGIGDQLKQVILNLFMNSVDAMANGGSLIVSTRWLAESSEILIAITDTGTGIDKSVLPYIFEAFITSKENGTGLGLAISYEIVLKHHGRIQAENNPEGGATFSIWLPVGLGDQR